jgi:ribosomal protein L11 methyltransferase
MSFPRKIENAVPNTPPYTDLYIYYIEGHVPSHVIFDRDFIGNWQEAEFTFLFFAGPARDRVDDVLALHSGLKLLDEYCMSYEEWQGGPVEPLEIGGFYVFPPWNRPPEDLCAHKHLKPVLLDPGVVFGTGTHPTTRDCLCALALALDDGPIESVLDLGTGTGLLALAAVKSGCRRVLAVDFNFLACQTAWNNVGLNRLTRHIAVAQGRAEDYIDSNADLLMANIHYDVMRDLIAAPGFLRKKRFILSGLLRSQAREVADTLARLPVSVLRTWQKDGTWFTYYGKSNPMLRE